MRCRDEWAQPVSQAFSQLGMHCAHPELFCKGFEVRGTLWITEQCCAGLSLGEISARIYTTPGMETPVLWGFIHWGWSPDAKMGECRGSGCCVWVPTRLGTAIPVLADYFPCGLVWEHLQENTELLNVVLWDLMAAWAKGSICLGHTCINHIKGKMNK